MLPLAEKRTSYRACSHRAIDCAGRRALAPCARDRGRWTFSPASWPPRATSRGFAAPDTSGRFSPMRVSGAAPGYLNPGTREGPRTNHPGRNDCSALNKHCEGSGRGGGVGPRRAPRKRGVYGGASAGAPRVQNPGEGVENMGVSGTSGCDCAQETPGAAYTPRRCRKLVRSRPGAPPGPSILHLMRRQCRFKPIAP